MAKKQNGILDDLKKKHLKKNYSVSLTISAVDRADAYAAQAGLDRSKIIDEALLKFLDSIETENLNVKKSET